MTGGAQGRLIARNSESELRDIVRDGNNILDSPDYTVKMVA